jgi:hypothetical protein
VGFLFLEHLFQYGGGLWPSLGAHVLDTLGHCGLVPGCMRLLETV